MIVTSQLYGQFLVNSVINFTGTYLAETVDGLSHDSVYRFLKYHRLTPTLIREKTDKVIEYSDNGYAIFDDTVLDKNDSRVMGLVRKQWSGAEHRIIRGIGLITALYYNPEKDRFYVLGYRLYDPDGDGKKKTEHVSDLLDDIIRCRVPFRTVLMDSWYSTTALMLKIGNDLNKTYYCPLKANRNVDDSGGTSSYKAVSTLEWSASELNNGKLIKVSKFPNAYKHKLFRVVVSSDRTDYVVTNDLTQQSTLMLYEKSATSVGTLRSFTEKLNN